MRYALLIVAASSTVPSKGEPLKWIACVEKGEKFVSERVLFMADGDDFLTALPISMASKLK